MLFQNGSGKILPRNGDIFRSYGLKTGDFHSDETGDSLVCESLRIRERFCACIRQEGKTDLGILAHDKKADFPSVRCQAVVEGDRISGTPRHGFAFPENPIVQKNSAVQKNPVDSIRIGLCEAAGGHFFQTEALRVRHRHGGVHMDGKPSGCVSEVKLQFARSGSLPGDVSASCRPDIRSVCRILPVLFLQPHHFPVFCQAAGGKGACGENTGQKQGCCLQKRGMVYTDTVERYFFCVHMALPFRNVSVGVWRMDASLS